MSNIGNFQKKLKELDNSANSLGTELQLVYDPPECEYYVTNSMQAYMAFILIWNKELMRIQEQCYALFLNQEREVICYRLINTGTRASCPIDQALIAAIALKCRAGSVVVAHNHPSGKLKPSRDDCHITCDLKRKLQGLDIELADHLIVKERGYFSFADENML
jgi:DNA repair protein RadC